MKKKEVIRTLKSERCPPEVLKRVTAEIRRSRPSGAGRRWSIYTAAAVVAGFLLMLILINVPDQSQVGQEFAVRTVDDNRAGTISVEDDYTQQAEELKFALAYIGLKLESEAERNRDIILRSTVPALKESIEDTGKYIKNRIRGKKIL